MMFNLLSYADLDEMDSITFRELEETVEYLKYDDGGTRVWMSFPRDAKPFSTTVRVEKLTKDEWYCWLTYDAEAI